MSCGLKEIPKEVYSLADSLEILDLSGNQLSDLPEELCQLSKLKIVFFSDNDFTVFPKVLARFPKLEMIGFKANRISEFPEDSLPPKLRWLILTNNRLSKLPDSIGLCVHMQKLMLAGNLLSTLPLSMQAFRNLELLRISANAFEQLPPWLLELPKLSWLAFGGNPCSTALSSSVHVREIVWSDLQVAQQLGEGASGNIYRALWQGKELALKVFKGEVTSDGLPTDEMQACMLAGLHPTLIPIEGILAGHPQQKQGLLMKLLPQGFKVLAGPPSFDTCTRDVYAVDTKFTMEQLLKTAHAIADVCVHVHALGLMHGDLYAHNILMDAEYNTLLSDFGAGWVYRALHSTNLLPLQQIEMRAYGCILEELLTYVDVRANEAEAKAMLDLLKSRCLQESVSQRPLFKDVLVEIEKIRMLES